MSTTIEHSDGTSIVTNATVEEQGQAVAAPSWLPLESNPEVLNPFVRRMGLPEDWGFADVFGLDEELLMMVPQPCVALCLLYPSTKISRPRREDLRKKKNEQEAAGAPSLPEGLFFVQQHDEIGNACGTIACLHTLSNCAAAGAFELNPGPLATFIESVKDKSVADRGWALANAVDLQELSDETAAAGETEGAGTDDAMDSHFICFVNIKGSLFELDGRTWDEHGQAFPVNHGPTTPETFVSQAAKIIREDFMARDPENYGFNVTALCKLD